MAKLTIIVGVGGSGKTHLCREIERTTDAKAFFDATLVNGDRRRAGHGCLGEMVACLLGGQRDCVMDESHLCHEPFRDHFRKFCDEHLRGVDQEWIFFENDLLACINNVFHDCSQNRHCGGARFRAVEDQGKKYVVPEPGSYPGYATPYPVYRRHDPAFGEIGPAMAWLLSEIDRTRG